MKFLIWGLGSIGQRHLSILKNECNHHIVALRSGKGTLGVRDAVDCSFNAFHELPLQELDGAVISNPTSMHVGSCIQILQEVGVPLFIEKPLGSSSKGILDLKELVELRKTPVLLGYHMAHHSMTKVLARALKEHRIGVPIASFCHWGSYLPTWHPWEDYKISYASRHDLGGGVTRTMCHELHLLTTLFGRFELIQAMEVQNKVLGIEVAEGILLNIRHTSGVTSSCSLSFSQQPEKRLLEVQGSTGTISCDFVRGTILLLEPNKDPTVLFACNNPRQLIDEAYKTQMRHFIEVAKGMSPPAVSLQDGITEMEHICKIQTQLESPSIIH